MSRASVVSQRAIEVDLDDKGKASMTAQEKTSVDSKANEPSVSLDTARMQQLAMEDEDSYFPKNANKPPNKALTVEYD